MKGVYMNNRTVKLLMPFLLAITVFMFSCKEEKEYVYKYQHVVDAMQGKWEILYPSDEYLRFTIDGNIIHSQNGTSLNLLFGTMDYEYCLVNSDLMYVIQESRYVPYRYNVSGNTLYLEFNGGTSMSADAPKTIYKFNKKL